MRISIDTETDALDVVVKTILSAYGQETVPAPAEILAATASVATSGSTVLPGGWTETKLRKWASTVKSDAQEIVRYISANGPEIPFDDVASYLGKVKGLPGPIDGKVIGGAMSSGGHVVNSIVGVNGQPIDRDNGRRLYVIDERFAAIFADELGPPQDL